MWMRPSMSRRGSGSSISSTPIRSAKICLQLGHSGGKGSTKLGWEGNDVPLDEGNWPVMAASRRALVAGQPGAAADDPRRHGRGPRPVRRRGPHGPRGRLRHGRAARRARLSAVELHHPAAATGAPTNMAAASRTACATRSKCSRRCAPPGRRDRPMSVRISANDWAGDDGVTPDEAVEIGRGLRARPAPT